MTLGKPKPLSTISNRWLPLPCGSSPQEMNPVGKRVFNRLTKLWKKHI